MSQAAGGILTINLFALQRNYKLLMSIAKPASIAAVVKADAYGIGARHAAYALYQAGCHIFFVAQLNEAMQLKSFLPNHAQIAILNDVQPGMETKTAAAGLIPVLNSLSSIKAWSALCQKKKRKFPAMLQLDTGMSRLGLNEKEVKKIAKNPEIFHYAKIAYLLSHLASDDICDSQRNIEQLASLEKLLAILPKSSVSFINSSGLALGPSYRFDLVRSGIALYGIKSQKDLPFCLQPVVKLEARVIQTRYVPAGTRVGYGGTYQTTQESKITTVSVGYADGWLRSLSNSGSAYFLGKRMPIIGRISMDSMTLDATALGALAPSRGDLVELIGMNQSLENVAHDAGTIPYEILTSLGKRYDLRYIPPSLQKYKNKFPSKEKR
ncbi:MAG: alanine racemase [Candidatus Tokpelaia sp. JSC161]|jgi:alanine racemase|nr:MAG: alanine racemase [Candidatus Tokpelaia sp. JSC161]